MALDAPRSAVLDHSPMLSRGWLFYLAFVLYGSLVPLDFQARSLEEAWHAFQRIPFLQLGVGSRADWIANGLLYVPLAFLMAVSIGARAPRTGVAVPLIGAFLFCCTFAVAVEFAQLFFPPRTVSLNDLLAEWCGSLAGAGLGALWRGGGFKFVSAAPSAAALRRTLLTLYALAYLLLCLFPYDFALSASELYAKLRGPNWGWLWSESSLRGGALITAMKLLAEVIAAVPLGFLLPTRKRLGFAGALALGAALGLMIEVAQLLVLSGVSQGISVLTRAVGVAVGAWLWRLKWDAASFAALLRRFYVPAALLYVFALLAANGWFQRSWGGGDLAASKLSELNFMPLFYHYYTSESVALLSLVVTLAMYAPIGLLGSALRASPLACGLVAVLAAFGIETTKLFLVGVRPDPSNIFIAAIAAWASARAFAAFQDMPTAIAGEDGRLRKTAVDAASRTGLGGASPDTELPWRVPSKPVFAVLATVLALIGWAVATFPIYPVLLGLLLAGYAAFVWRHPPLLVAAVPAALPLLDLAPWSGRFYFDEFDLFILVSVAIGYARVPPARRGPFDAAFTCVIMLVALSYAISAARSMLPWQMPGINSFNNYYSPFNALRIAKGALWAILLFGLFRRFAASGHDIRRLFAWGVSIGLAGTVAVIAWERLAFSGLFNFANGYRATGPFSAIHTGGAYTEVFLTAATPFLVFLLLHLRSVLLKLAVLALLLATTYALMVTFSRAGYVAFVLALGLICLIAAMQWLRRSQHNIGLAVSALTLAALVIAVAVPILKGPYAQARLSLIATDLAIREAHWKEAMQLRDSGWATTFFGSGIGRYPETRFWHGRPGNRSATYQLVAEAENAFLRLGSGAPIFVEQFVKFEPGRKYLLSLDARASQPGSKISVPICEKWMLTSFRCAWSTINIGEAVNTWRRYEVAVMSGEIAKGRWYSARPVKLSIYNPNRGATVDVDNVRLEDSKQVNVLANADFSGGLDRWFFSSDTHLFWHVHSMPLAILFDQGWLGVVALGLLVALAVKRALSNAWSGDIGSAVLLASLAAVLAIGVFDAVIDTPRFLLLFMLLAGLASMRLPSAAQIRLHR